MIPNGQPCQMADGRVGICPLCGHIEELHPVRIQLFERGLDLRPVPCGDAKQAVCICPKCGARSSTLGVLINEDIFIIDKNSHAPRGPIVRQP
jgi:hypothetical protein